MRSGGCLAFDGTDDYVDCGSGTSLDITTAITLSAWAKTTNSSTVQMIVEKSPSGTNGYNILSSNGQFQGRIYPSSIVSTAMLSDGVWHHIVMSNQNVINGWNLYFDGAKVAQQNGVAILTNAQPLYIGMRGGGTSLPFTGLMDDVRIYNQAIPTSQIRQDYCLGLNKLLLNSSINKEEFTQRLSGLSNSLADN
ncbi:MAG: LamG domain-containing protein [Candidatus Paceibacterota bacterium]